MRSKSILRAMVLALVSMFLPSIIQAQGVIIPIVCDIRPCRPRPVPQPLPNVLPVRSIEIDTKIDGQVATTHLTQVFQNNTSFTLEGTYFFPIPEDATISNFAIWENGKKLNGEIRSREEARRIYDEIVRRQRDPGLLEYAGKDLFQASIFPIPANSDKKLEMTYTQVLRSDSGTVSYRYPLGTGRNLWRGRITDQRQTSVSQPFGTVSGRIEIKGRSALRNIYSPTHQIDTRQKGETGATVTFETKGNDSDFQLYYSQAETDLGVSLITYREAGKDGYFMLMASPKDAASSAEIINKDIVFVLDTSGSMADEGKIEKARKALLFGIRTLRDGDRFNVINFAGDEHLMEARPIAADAAGKRRGEEFVNKLQPSGGTNINDSLIASLKQFEKGSRPKMIVFMTDGLPTVGVTNYESIVANLKNARNIDVRIFPFGFGYDVNTTLLDRIGTENGGISDYVQPKEDLEVKVSNFFSRVSSPVLSDLDLDFGPVVTEATYPKKLTDLFRGMQSVIVGRYKNTNDLKNITLKLTGKNGAVSKTFDFKGLDFPARNEENDFLPRLWASRRVGWLLEEIRNNGESKELRDEVIDLGTRYGLVTPYTSYLATDGSVATLRRDVKLEARRALPKAKDLETRSGAGAVQMSVQQNAMKMNTQISSVRAADDKANDLDDEIIVRNSTQNQFVGTRNFINVNNVWTDSEYSDTVKLPERNFKFASDEYFDLVKSDPELGSYLSLGDQVVIIWKGNVLRITK